MIVLPRNNMHILTTLCETSNLYVLSKTHKSNTIKNKVKNSSTDYIEIDPPHDIKGRLVISEQNYQTQHLSEIPVNT